ncbi:hypothetical protein F5Y13DRAFT_162612 [Hypoxylon sp. FL1857]|nr:hypothetical protein F5Y13DRAFT_162612 [Hypoxylon sp. FL1857]
MRNVNSSTYSRSETSSKIFSQNQPYIMSGQSVITYFHTLAALATFLLWGICLLNGTVKALLIAVWNGRFDNEVALKTNYTGIPLIDYPIALLVAFFFYGTNGQDHDYNLFLVDAYSTLQSAFVWLYIEASRPGSKPKWVEKPMVFGILWQCFGAAISLPLYYALHVSWANQSKTFRAVNADMAKAIPFGFLLGAVAPAIIGMAPTWNGPESRTAEMHQNILFAWQPDPIWVSLIQTGIITALPLFHRTASRENGISTAQKWIGISYILAALSSALGHLYTMGSVLCGPSPIATLRRMYVPFPFSGPAGVTNIFTLGPWLFLQYDLIIIGLSSLSWAYIMLARVSNGKGLSHGALALTMLVGSLTIGPGATVSLALLARERLLPVYAKGQK